MDKQENTNRGLYGFCHPMQNGDLNLSELDGWWDEAYTDQVGWAMGDEAEHGDDPGRDAFEADTLYNLLENQIVPEFYKRNEFGLPVRWIERIRKSMSQLTPKFSANRTVREYTDQYYIPAANCYLHRAEENGAAGLRIVTTKHDLQSKWPGISAGKFQIKKVDNGYQCSVIMQLNGINTSQISVELYAENSGNSESEIIKMDAGPTPQQNGGFVFQAHFASSRPVTDFTLSVIPSYENINVPLEHNLIFWQH